MAVAIVTKLLSLASFASPIGLICYLSSLFKTVAPMPELTKVTQLKRKLRKMSQKPLPVNAFVEYLSGKYSLESLDEKALDRLSQAWQEHRHTPARS